jgi:hypothetical protein
MNHGFPAPPDTIATISEPAPTLTWMDVWISAITEPSAKTYENFLRDPKVSSRRAFGWIFFSSLFGFFISFLLQILLNRDLFNSLSINLNTPIVLGVFGIVLVCAAPLTAGLSVFGLIISAGLTQWIATGLGGKGNFTELAYAIAAFSAPITLASSLIASIPLINLLSIFLGIYALVLNIIAIKAANRFGYGSAIATVILLWVGMIVVIGFIVVLFLVLLGPAIGNFFQNIQNDLMQSIPIQ